VYKNTLETALQGLYLDTAQIIINSLCLNTLIKCTSINEAFRKIVYHHLAIRKAKLYSQIFTPEDWNLSVKSARKMEYDECKNAFRTLPLDVNLEHNAIAFAIKGFSINGFSIMLKEKFPYCQEGYQYLSEPVKSMLGDNKVQNSCWISVPRFGNKFRKFSKDDLILKTLKTIIAIFTEQVKFNRPLFTKDFGNLGEISIKENIVITTTVKMGMRGIDVYSTTNRINHRAFDNIS